ncbi:MAG: sirohydrochlorin cobaltochelatase [Clostridiales bacterium]|nr:sirohydrochlorin cobaltochelatase [Clostridiales bacterium]
MQKAIILVSFGTTYEEARRLCIDSIEDRIREEFRGIHIFRAYTSRIIINILKKRDNYLVDNLEEALIRATSSGVYNIYIQPLFVLPGKEYSKLKDQVKEFIIDNSKVNIQVGKPLLGDDLDYDMVVRGLDSIYQDIAYDEGIVFMGHGCDPYTDKAYERLEQRFRQAGYPNVFIGTLKGRKTIDEIIPTLQGLGIKKVKLMPFMFFAGSHATNDMVSGKDSWQDKLLSSGIRVEPIIMGLGQIKEIQDIYINHLDILNI